MSTKLVESNLYLEVKDLIIEARKNITRTNNSTIGLILCEGKNDTAVKYALSGVVKPIFASVYELVLSSEEEFKKIINNQRALLKKKI